MKVIAAIRTHVWGDQEDRIMAQLMPVFGDDLCVVFHNRKPDVVPPIPVVDLTDAWVEQNGLRRISDYGWRCGDYFLYALRQARPDADFYWIIEPDVLFTGDPAEFFARTGEHPVDLIGAETEALGPHHRFAVTLTGLQGYRCLFALTRVSGLALDKLFALRQIYSAQAVPSRRFANDEAFVWSHVKADRTLTTAVLVDIVPEWLRQRKLRADPDMLLDSFDGLTEPGVFHPVQSRQHFARAVAKRIAGSLSYLGRMTESLAFLTDQEIADMTEQVAKAVEANLRAARDGAQ